MKDIQSKGRLVGALLLIVFIVGVIIFQVLQGTVLFDNNYLTIIPQHSKELISSVILGIVSGLITISISVVMLPILREYSPFLAYLYTALCIVNLIAIMIDNLSVLSMLEISNASLNGTNNSLDELSTVYSMIHWWTHYLHLLISCFPAFTFYLALYLSRLIPKVFSVFGIGAVLLMFIEMMFSIYGNSISMNMLLPMALIQLSLPFYLMVKGFKPESPQVE